MSHRHRVCPWWLGYWLVCPIRIWWQSPQEILVPYVYEGMTVLEPGPGMGYFTLELARLVGASGRVVCVDVQERMIARLKHRAAKAALLDRLDARVSPANSMGLDDMRGSVDFTLAFAVVHEFPDPAHFFAEVSAASRVGALLLLAEPSGHVRVAGFDSQLLCAEACGFRVVDHPKIRRSHTALLKRA